MKKKLITHNAKFHTDDVFAVATLLILLGEENCEVIRTRDESLIAAGDYVVDVGNVYDEEKNRFDHHQAGGAGERANGIPYASFGLVWKRFGEEVCGSLLISEKLDKYLVQQIDAVDNGYDIFSSRLPNLFPFDINSLVNQFRLTWKEEGDWDERFLEVVSWAKSVIEREIKFANDYEKARQIVVEAYKKAPNKRLVQVDKKYDVGREIAMSTLAEFEEPLFVILYREDAKNWQLVAIMKNDTFESRKPLPENWRAKRDKELEEVTGVMGAVFCHRSGFMCIAQSEEGILELAKIALEN